MISSAFLNKHCLDSNNRGYIRAPNIVHNFTPAVTDVANIEKETNVPVPRDAYKTKQ